MSEGNELAVATLETLPFSVAVIDDDGEILLTNRAWREFGPDDSTDYVGVNYVATAAMNEDDEHASRAVAGLEGVLEGERDQFAMEYPCHSPDQKRWFTMRAIRFTVGDGIRVAVAHLEITDRKLAEIAADESARRAREKQQALEHVLERLDGLVREVTDTAVNATSRETIERRVCEQFVDTDPYVGAWIGRLDVASQRVTPQTGAGVCDLADDEGRGTIQSDIELDDHDRDVDETHPAVHAIETAEPQLRQVDGEGAVGDGGAEGTVGEGSTGGVGGDGDGAVGDWWPAGDDAGVRSVVAVPLIYGDVTYGVLVLYVDTVDAVSERELAVLDALGRTISTAINAIEAQQMVTSDGVVDIELAIEDDDLFVTALADELEAPLEYRGLAYDDGTPLAFVHVDRNDVAEEVTDPADAATGAAEAVTDAAETRAGAAEAVVDPAEMATAVEAVTEVTVVAAHEDGILLEVALEDGLVTTLGEHGAMIRRLTVSDGIADLALEMANGQAARSVYGVLEDRYGRVELRSYHESEQPSRTPWDLAATIESKLTDRQQLALRKAYAADYFAWPRGVSGEELAASMDISRSTFHQHLRSAQRKVVEELFDGGVGHGSD